MAPPIAVGDEAPNFDLSSTEDVLLMLRDEVSRMAVLLYFFFDPSSERARADLAALASARDDLARKWVVAMGISPAKLPELKNLQAEMSLPFPLLTDDRDFSEAYGVEKPAVEVSEDESAAGSAPHPASGPASGPALFLVDSGQKVVWMSNPVDPAETVIPKVLAVAGGLAGPTSNTPGSVVNRVVDWWVNRLRKPRVAV